MYVTDSSGKWNGGLNIQVFIFVIAQGVADKYDDQVGFGMTMHAMQLWGD